MCPKGIEATFYAFVTAVINLGYLMSYWFGGILTYWLHITSTDFDKLWILITISSIFPIVTLIFLTILPKESKLGIHTIDEPININSIASESEID
jgi:hypothetical protein